MASLFKKSVAAVMGLREPVWKSASASGARQFFTKSFLGDGAAVLARSSGEEPASSRHRAGGRIDGVEDDATMQRERAVKF